jgi:hypothetical protein
MEEAYHSDSDSSDVSDAHSSSLSLQYSSSSVEDTSLSESDEQIDLESGKVEPYQYEPEGSTEEHSVGDSADGDDDDDSMRERLDNTNG